MDLRQQAPAVPAPRGDRRGADRRGGDRRRGQAATLLHRRATDVRMDGAQASALLARKAMQRSITAPGAVAPQPSGVVDLVDRVVDLEQPQPQVRCPECGVPCDRLWLVRHVVEAHPGWP